MKIQNSKCVANASIVQVIFTRLLIIAFALCLTPWLLDGGQENLPAWIYGLLAIAYFIHWYADGLDGGHARATKQSSTLGEFLDHTLDPINFGLITLLSFLALEQHLSMADSMF